MTFIFIDRRKAGKGKSSANRQKLFARIRSFIKASAPQNIGTGGVAQVYSSGRNANNPVKVAKNALEEPWFAYGKGGDDLLVILGNTDYDRGDLIELNGEDSEDAGAGPGEAGEDDFVVNVAANDFLELFFEDCELPNLDDEKAVNLSQHVMTHAGFAKTGNAGQLSIVRSYKNALARRLAMSSPYRQEKNELEERMKEIYSLMGESSEDETNERFNNELDQIEARIAELNRKIAAISSFDVADLRYHKKEPQPLKQVDAVLVMVMDISGSMGQEEKTIARRWFALLYAFIKRRYENTDLIFIAHTDEAFEMSEDDFFSTKINGGTSVSPALALVNEIINKRYDPNHTNIYVSHASDGDNWESVEGEVQREMSSAGGLMSKIQYFSYVEVGEKPSWAKKETVLWAAYKEVQSSMTKKMSMSLLGKTDDCYPVFKQVFKKK